MSTTRTLPAWDQLIAHCIPLMYLLEYFRQFYGFMLAGDHVLLKAYCMAAAYLGQEIMVMKATLVRAKRTGILLKLSE